jgi:hypothetical protein
MRARSDTRLAVALLAAAIALPTLACTKKPSNARSPDASSGEPQPGGGDPLAELDSLEREMQRLGLPVAASRATTPTGVLEGSGEGGGMDMDGDGTVGAQAEAFEEEAPVQPAPAEAEPDRSPDRRGQAQRCSDVCDLREAICELEVQICSLSEGHGDDPTYANACRRAGDDCDTADDECDRCGA